MSKWEESKKGKATHWQGNNNQLKRENGERYTKRRKANEPKHVG